MIEQELVREVQIRIASRQRKIKNGELESREGVEMKVNAFLMSGTKIFSQVNCEDKISSASGLAHKDP